MRPLGILVVLLLISSTLSGQYKWNWKDPADFNQIDLGDNKVLIYNGLALGLTYLFSKTNTQNPDKFNSFSFEIINEYRKDPLSDIFNLKYREGWKFRKFLWLGYEVAFMLVDDKKIIPGFGISPFFSWNIFNKPTFRLSYDNGVGPVYFFNAFPEGGTRFNFNTFYGINLEIKAGNESYSIGIRNTHISNASIAGNERNPGFDGLGGYLKIRM